MRVATSTNLDHFVDVHISIHATHAGGDQAKAPASTARANFNPRHPCGWRPIPQFGGAGRIYFNPRHPCGWRLQRNVVKDGEKIFQSTPPMRVATCMVKPTCSSGLFQSTPPMRVATSPCFTLSCATLISIHATHAGGDHIGESDMPFPINFNPRHPCGWRRGFRSRINEGLLISIHATHAGGDGTNVFQFCILIISIHATHAGGDVFTSCLISFCTKFQSTPPMRVATCTHNQHLHGLCISIHATHAGGDICGV